MTVPSAQVPGARRVRIMPGAMRATALVLLASAPVLAACGSSGATSTVPPTAGLGLGSAVDAVCGHGLRVQLDATVDAVSPRQAPHTSVARLMRVTGTTPPAGASVRRGAVVTLHYEHPSWEGEELVATTGDHCLVSAPPAPLGAAGRAAIAAVAASPAWRVIAGQFPATNQTVGCTIRAGGPVAGIPIPGTCITDVNVTPIGFTSVGYIESWPAARFSVSPRHTGDLSHEWTFMVDPKGRIVSAMSGGDVPPQAAR
jgi:hypothetical protein